MTTPSAQDIENARLRAEIAARFKAEYDQCAAWAEQLFGPGYEPSHRHFLVDKQDEDRCRHTGERPTPAATVFTVRHIETGERRHFMLPDGKPVEVSSYQEGFGSLLLEPHPTMRIEVRGQMVAPHRYSLCWSSIETYKPRSAEALAAARERREERNIERQADENPLFSQQIRSGQWRPERKPRGRTPG
jgi:hypothetical protein